MRRLLTEPQAETLARLFYGLPERTYKGKPLRNRHLTWMALTRKGLVAAHKLTAKGVRELYRHMKKPIPEEYL